MSLKEIAFDVGPQSAMSTAWTEEWKLDTGKHSLGYNGTAFYHGLTSDVEGSLFAYGDFIDFTSSHVTPGRSGIRKFSWQTIGSLSGDYNTAIWDWEYPSGSTNDVQAVSAVVDLDMFVYAVELDNTTGDSRLVKLSSAGGLIWASTQYLGTANSQVVLDPAGFPVRSTGDVAAITGWLGRGAASNEIDATLAHGRLSDRAALADTDGVPNHGEACCHSTSGRGDDLA